jgi:hypothetical protein
LNHAEMLALDEVHDPDTMKKARHLVQHFRKSNQQHAKLIAQQKNMDTYTGKQAVDVVVDVLTRWWSAYSAMCTHLIYLQPALAAIALDKKIPEYILLNEIDWKILRQAHQLLESFKESQELFEGDKYVPLCILPIAIKAIRAALKEIVDAKGDGVAQKRIKNLAKRLLFDFCERWKPDEASQFLECGIVTRGLGIRQVGLHPPLAAFAFALDPRTKQLKAYSKKDCQKIWAGLQQKAMEHCQLLGGPLELDQQEVVNNTNQNEGAVKLQPPDLKISFLKHVLDWGQEVRKM